jgi:hypothetical protein
MAQTPRPDTHGLWTRLGGIELFAASPTMVSSFCFLPGHVGRANGEPNAVAVRSPQPFLE